MSEKQKKAKGPYRVVSQRVYDSIWHFLKGPNNFNATFYRHADQARIACTALNTRWRAKRRKPKPAARKKPAKKGVR